jgi:hypothetical protein
MSEIIRVMISITLIVIGIASFVMNILLVVSMIKADQNIRKEGKR